MAEFKITECLLTKLIIEQFPHWKNLSVKPVDQSGWDNRSFRLGTDMLVRLPSAQEYAPQVLKEQEWLPFLASQLEITIPKPLALGKPSELYPWHWSIYNWIEGASVNTLLLNNLDLKFLASDLAKFLNELHKIDTTGGPMPGAHNFYRGGSLSVYDSETRAALKILKNYVDSSIATTAQAVWDKALSFEWSRQPVWIHGDISTGNILVKDNRLAAVIDFGCMAIGDPACDLVIAWNFLTEESRELFKAQVCLDDNTWARARGWAIWKALVTLTANKDKSCPKTSKQLQIINQIITEHKL